MKKLTNGIDVVEIQTFEYKTLRDEFAAAALTGILAYDGLAFSTEHYDSDDFAATAYSLADAMMKARQVRDEE